MPKQIIQDTFETLGNLAKDTGKAVVSEPLNIIKDLLGEDVGSDEKGQGSAQQALQTQQNAQQAPQAAALQQLRQQDEMQNAEKLAKIRQQMQYLQKQKAESDRLDAEKQQEDEGENSEQQQQQEVVQLQQEQEKASVLQGNLKALEGTKENGPRKQF